MKYFIYGCVLCFIAIPVATGEQGDPRVVRLNEVARRISTPQTPAPNEPATQAAASGISLLAPEGQAFVGRQLDSFDRAEPGVLRALKPSWINLYWTESRDFILSGEVNLGGEYSPMLFPGDLPDGFALFLREWDGVQRYQVDSRRVLVKRRLHKGRATGGIETVDELAPSPKGQWLSFRVNVSQGGIQFQFGQSSATLDGPLDIDGANKILIAPGTRLRNLRLSFDSEPPTVERPTAVPTVSAAPSKVSEIQNGSFDTPVSGDERGQFGETMFSPDSKLLSGWTVTDGLVGLRNNPQSPAGGFALELGPRDTPGTISQTIRTEPGKPYELSFLACSGRRGANRQVVVRVGDMERTIDCADGETYERVSLPFKAVSPQTTISVSGAGASGFGPVIDDVRVK
jgi:hypothetical protein